MEKKTEYQVELVWNRSFNFVPFGKIYATIDEARKKAQAYLDMGDGASVKKCQIVNADTREVVVESHKIYS